MEKIIMFVGGYSPGEVVTVKDMAAKVFGPIKLMEIQMMPTELLATLSFNDSVCVVGVIIGTRYLFDESIGYQEIREKRNCKIVLCLQDNAKMEEYFTDESFPDYFLNVSSGELVHANTKVSNFTPVE